MPPKDINTDIKPECLKKLDSWHLHIIVRQKSSESSESNKALPEHAQALQLTTTSPATETMGSNT